LDDSLRGVSKLWAHRFPRFVADLAIMVDVDVGYLAKDIHDVPTGSETRNGGLAVIGA